MPIWMGHRFVEPDDTPPATTVSAATTGGAKRSDAATAKAMALRQRAHHPLRRYAAMTPALRAITLSAMRRRVERSNAVRDAADIGVERDWKHTTGIGALSIEHVERSADHVAELGRRYMHPFVGRLVVGLLRIRYRDQAAAVIEVHDIGLIVVAPVAHISAALRGQEIERIPGFLQSRTEPAFWPHPGGAFDRCEGAFDDVSLFARRRVIQPAGIAFVMAHPFPSALVALLDDDRMVIAQQAVERDRGADAVAVQHLHHAPYADTVAIIALGPHHDIGDLRGGAVAGRTLLQ